MLIVRVGLTRLYLPGLRHTSICSSLQSRFRKTQRRTCLSLFEGMVQLMCCFKEYQTHHRRHHIYIYIWLYIYIYMLAPPKPAQRFQKNNIACMWELSLISDGTTLQCMSWNHERSNGRFLYLVNMPKNLQGQMEQRSQIPWRTQKNQKFQKPIVTKH